MLLMSYPLRVRGLKLDWRILGYRSYWVVPLEGTWIEIGRDTLLYPIAFVVPLEGTWIEIYLLNLVDEKRCCRTP